MNHNDSQIKVSLVWLFFITMGIFTAHVQAACTTSGDVITLNAIAADTASQTPVTDSVFGANDQCTSVPDEYKLTFYKLALCTADPSSNDLSSCSYMFEDSAGVDHVISYPSEGTLDVPPFEFPVGTYPYMAIVLSNKLGIKNTMQFSGDVEGESSSTGVYCWTGTGAMTSFVNEALVTPHGTTVTGKTLTCGNLAAADAATKVFNYEVIVPLASNSACASFSNTFSTPGDPNTSGFSMPNGDIAKGRLLQATEVNATTCLNASKILWTIAISPPAVVTPLSEFTLNFKTVDAASINFSSSSVGNTIPDIQKVGAYPVQVYLSLTSP